MRLLFVGDVHLSDRPPSTRTETYADDILEKMAEVGQIAIEREAQAIVYAGDIFHSKVPHRTSHELVQRAIRIFRAQSKTVGQVFVLPGNHDYRGAQVEELRRSPLGTVIESGEVRAFGLPWKRQVSVAPPPGMGLLYGVREEEGLEAFEALPDSWVGDGVVVAHSAIFPPRLNPPFAYLRAEEVAAAVGKARHEVVEGARWRWVLYGHIHEPHGHYEVDGVNFVNPGSLSRGSLWEENPQRIPQVALIDTTKGSVEFIPLSAKPWDEVFRIAEEHEKRDRSMAAADFASELVSARVEVFSVERVKESLRSRDDAPTRVVERAIELVEKVAD